MGHHFTKTLIVVRHAHRDKSEGREKDNGLSEKGWQQARGIARHFERRYGGIPVRIQSSPKARCVQTVLAIADLQKKKIDVLEDLDEQTEKESERAFRLRVKKYLARWRKSKDPVTLLCTHGDWIPVFFEQAIGLNLELKKGGWAELELKKGARLTWVLQEW